MPTIKLDEHSLKQVMVVYNEIDELTDHLQSIYGDNWGELNPLGNVWSDLYQVIEHHVGENNVEDAVRKCMKEMELLLESENDNK